MMFVLLSMNGIGVVCEGVTAGGLCRWSGQVCVSCLGGPCGCYLLCFVMVMVVFVVMVFFYRARGGDGEWLCLWKSYSYWEQFIFCNTLWG